jgi:putative ABC transport system permease protein
LPSVTSQAGGSDALRSSPCGNRNRNVRRESLALEEKPSFYAPVLQDWTRQLRLLVRTAGDPLALLPSVRERLRALDPTLPLFDVTTLDDVVTSASARERFLLALLTAFAGVALVLAAVGVFGVVSYSTTRRTREIGIRIALGARRGTVAGLVLRQGLAPVLAGIAAGLVLAVLLVRGMASMLFGVAPFDPLTFAGVVGLLLLAAVLGCALPARRATRVDAVAALRSE